MSDCTAVRSTSERQKSDDGEKKACAEVLRFHPKTVVKRPGTGTLDIGIASLPKHMKVPQIFSTHKLVTLNSISSCSHSETDPHHGISSKNSAHSSQSKLDMLSFQNRHSKTTITQTIRPKNITSQVRCL